MPLVRLPNSIAIKNVARRGGREKRLGEARGTGVERKGRARGREKGTEAGGGGERRKEGEEQEEQEEQEERRGVASKG